MFLKMNRNKKSRNTNQETKARITDETENRPFSTDLETRIDCDASRHRLGTSMVQLIHESSQTVCFESRLFSSWFCLVYGKN